MNSPYRYDENAELDIVEGAGLTLTVRRLGAEMIGLARRRPGREPLDLLWRSARLDDPPRFWKSHATLLFPIVGRLEGLRSRTTDGVEVHFHKLHGFARDRRFALLGRAGDAAHYALHYTLVSDAETLELYPWRFELWATYELFPDRLTQTLTVVNREARPLPFQLGWHPGFNTPFAAGEKSGCHLRLPAGDATLVVNDDECRRTGERRAIALSGDFPFTEIGLDRTYMFDFSETPPAARVVELLDPDQSVGLRVRFPDYPHLGLWSDAGAPFICIEPWQGMDDAVVPEPFDKKFGMLLLPPGAQREFHASIEMIE
jgi:galactose mutarotase-like enzyme